MFGLELDNTVLLKQEEALERAASANPKTFNELKKLIRKVIKKAREDMVAAAGSKMQSDPRGAAYSVRRIVYKRVLGGAINLFNHRTAGKQTTYEPPKKLRPGQRGGNRVKRGANTQRYMSYGPHDRQMILLWLNQGANRSEPGKKAGSRGGRLSGNRGIIAPRNFFGTAGSNIMNKALNDLSLLIDTEIIKILNNNG